MDGGGHSLRLTLAQEPRRKRFFSIGCWFTAGFVAGNNSDLGAALIVLTEVGLIASLGSGIMLILATWRT
jgi:hypothetical protein